MAERDRLGAEVRTWTRRVAALMRTPDEGLEAFAVDQGLPDGVTVGQLQLLRALLDDVAAGMEQPAGGAFWSRVEAARELIARGAPPPAPAATPPPANLERTAGLPSLETLARAAPGDFRGKLVGPPPAPTSRSTREDWRPAAEEVQPPFDAQEWTMGMEESDDEQAFDLATVKLDAVQAPLHWTVERVAAMTVALSRFRLEGQPTIEAICEQLGLPDRGALEVAWHVSQQRLREDPDLARRHEALVRAWSVTPSREP